MKDAGIFTRLLHQAMLAMGLDVAAVHRRCGTTREQGDTSIVLISTRLDIKPRALRAELSKADTNFNQLLSNYRYLIAKRLLAKTDESIDEIVYFTGFSEPSTFNRAFKRWSDTTPVEYRKLKLNTSS